MRPMLSAGLPHNRAYLLAGNIHIASHLDYTDDWRTELDPLMHSSDTHKQCMLRLKEVNEYLLLT